MPTNHQIEPAKMGLAPGLESRHAALRSIAKIDATVRRDQQSARRERWLGEVEKQLQRGVAMVAKLRAEPGSSIGERTIGSGLGKTLARVNEQRRRIAIGRVLLAGRVKGMLPERVAASQPVHFRDSDAESIATARAVVRQNPTPKRIEPGSA